jgi:multidrug resistance efflux pump
VMAKETKKESVPAANPVRRWTLIVLCLVVILITWYLISDRITPFTSQARVHALVVPIASEISGTVIDVKVANNEFVTAGQELFRIDPSRYQFAVDTAEAELQSARQTTGASTENVNAARANVGGAKASLVRAEQDAQRLRAIKQEDPGAISERRLESAEASLDIASAQVTSAQANLEKAIADMGKAGEDNSRILQAQANLAQARIDLARTVVVAPDDGLVTDVRLNRGNFAAAGAPQMTFVASGDVWIQADFTENNLGHIELGSVAEIVFDALPGRVFQGRVRSAGFGVDVASAALGSLPSVENDRQWLRQAQRFPVLVDFDLPDPNSRLGMRIGAQASVRVYTGDHPVFNRLGRWYMKALSYTTYAY